MADKKETYVKRAKKEISGSDVLTVGAIGVGALAAYWIFKGISAASGSDERIAAMESYVEEMEELVDYQNSLAALGRELYDYEVQTLESMLHWVQLKEKNAQAKGWGIDFLEYLKEEGIKLGILLGSGLVLGWAGYQLLKKLWRDRGGGGPPNFICPIDNEVFDNHYDYEAHIRSHPITYDPVKIQNAQAKFSQLPAWTQNSVMTTSGLYMNLHDSWEYQWETTFAYELLVGMSQAKAHHEGTAGALIVGFEICQTVMLALA